MLKQLTIKNFALIEALDASFSQGMTCITGETGAGKSILLGGLSLVLGKRADMSSLLDPEKKCIVEASFDIGAYQLKTLFAELDLDYDPYTVLRREILPQGKSRAFINDTPVNLGTLEEVSRHLIDLHSQNDTMSLLADQYQFEVLDALGANKKLLSDYQSTLSLYKRAVGQYQSLQKEAEEAKATQELDHFLFQELQQLNLEEGLEEDIERKLGALTHVDFLQSTLAEAIQYFESEDVGVIDQLLKLRGMSMELEKRSQTFSPLASRFNALFIEAEDLLRECKDSYENLETDPEALALFQAKYDVLNNQMLKHKVNTVNELITVMNQLENRLNKTLNTDQELARLKAAQIEYKTQLNLYAAQLSENRKKAVTILEQELSTHVSKMGMPEAVFKIVLTPSSEFLSNGRDVLDFQFKSNRGSSFQPLKKIASGGELSRIMLSVKAILSAYIKLPTLIFDEIDTGVSGKISDSIAEVMVGMSQKLQIINITHLPQVAAKSHYHFKVAKTQHKDKTITELLPLDQEARIDEIALMLSGNQVTPTAVAHAKQLMN